MAAAVRLSVEVQGDDIIVTLPGTSYVVTYYRAAAFPQQLLTKSRSGREVSKATSSPLSTRLSVDGATTVVWLVKGYDAFVAKRRQNWLVSPNRPQVLYEFIGTRRETDGSEGDESTRRGDPQALPSIESVHCRSPSESRLKTIL
jgi:hypothetical protein